MRGAISAISAASPPAMTVKPPSRAAAGPPETGASIQRMPFAAVSFDATSRATSGLTVERSITSLRDRGALARPCSPKTQLRTAGASSTHISRNSLPAATAAGASARMAPAGTTRA